MWNRRDGRQSAVGDDPSGRLSRHNFVRLAVYDYASPSALRAYVTDLTSHGIVVELEDHTNSSGADAGGSQGQIFSGQQLTNELNWYSSIASAFKNNPYVWFGTDNEPSEVDASGKWDPAALSDWQLQTYNAIRKAGNNSPVMLEANGWASNGAPVMLQGYNAADYASMTNVIWDPHYYGWLTNYSTDQATNNNFVAEMIQQVQQIKSADGTIPVIFGEYGNSTDGVNIDANGSQVIQAVLNSGAGNVAWAWGSGNPGDGLINNDGSLSSYGQLVAAGIAAQAAKSATSTPTPTPTPSANDTVVKAGSTAAITDASGNLWTITSGGQVAVNGAADTTTANVVEIAYVNGVVWQENGLCFTLCGAREMLHVRLRDGIRKDVKISVVGARAEAESHVCRAARRPWLDRLVGQRG
jgi:Cellulase (glycosyl hydrolase family 5)